MSRSKIFLLLTTASLYSISYAAESDVATNNVAENQAFQDFDNQYYIGYGLGYGNTKNGYGQRAAYSTNSVGFGVEKLFDMGVWIAFDGVMVSDYVNHSSNPNAQANPVGQDPMLAALDVKVGYAFPVLKDTLLLTPYGTFGRNTNISSTSLKDNMTPDGGGTNTITVNSTKDYFLASGVGGRLEYRVDSVFDFYFDQNFVYNIDMSNPNAQYAPMSNISLNSTLGAKFNVWRELQLGAQTFYSYSALTHTLANSQQYDLVPENTVGGMITVGLTY